MGGIVLVGAEAEGSSLWVGAGAFSEWGTRTCPCHCFLWSQGGLGRHGCSLRPCLPGGQAGLCRH